MLGKTLIIFCFLISAFNATFIGVDLGSDFFKINMLKPGKTFTMVENIQSKTNTHAGVTLKDRERFIGPECLISKGKNPKQTLNFIDRFLGELYGNTKIDKYIKDHYIAYDLEEDSNRKTYLFKLKYKNEDFLISPEEHFGMIFRFIKMISEKFSGTKIHEVAVSVPNSWGYKKRQSLSTGVKLANLELKSLFTHNTAAAVHFMTDKTFNETTNYIFYNMGSSYTQASLVSMKNIYETDKNNKTTERKEMNVIAETWDDELGGRDIDVVLTKELMKRHDESDQKKGKPSCLNDYKVFERILQNTIKYKEMLSANKEVPINILGIESGMNLKTIYTRNDLENNLSFLNDRVYTPIEKLLNMTGYSIDDIAQVELIGGSIRVPLVQEILKKNLGENRVGMHMNGDDSTAFGTTYMFANTTKQFKVAKKIYINSGAPYELKINIDSYTNKTQYHDPCTDTPETMDFLCFRNINKTTTLFKIRHGSDITRTVSFKHDSDIKIDLMERMEGSSDESKISTFYVYGYDDVKLRLKEDNATVLPKTHLKFKSSEAGFVSLTADITYEVDTYFSKVVGENNTVDFKYITNYTAPLSEEELASELELLKQEGKNETDNYYVRLKSIGKTKKSEKVIDLKVEREFSYPRPMNRTEFLEAKRRLDEIDQDELIRMKEMEIRNNLETDIYKRKDWLEREELKDYAKPEELEQINNSLKTISEWYEEDGWNANSTALQLRHDELKDSIAPLEKRIEKHEKIQRSTERFNDELKKVRSETIKIIGKNEWLNGVHHETFTLELIKTETWVNEKLALHNESPKHEDPTISHDIIDNKIRTIHREFKKFREIPKPKDEKSDDKKTETKDTKAEEEWLEKLRKSKDAFGDMSEEEKEKILNSFVRFFN